MDLETIKRNDGIDSLRSLAIFAVICIHVKPFENSEIFIGRLLETLVILFSRFAVPFFYIVAGYLWEKKDDKFGWSASKKYIIRILKIILLWNIVYIVPYDLLNNINLRYANSIIIRLTDLIRDPLNLIFEGTKVHLWFLPSLILSVLISKTMIYFKAGRYLIFIALLLYILGLLGGAYSPCPIGIKTEFNTRNGPFFSMIFFYFGSWFSRHDNTNIKDINIIMIIIIGFVSQLIESFVLWKMYGMPPTHHDYLIGTLIFGIGMALFAISKPCLGRGTWLADIGMYTPGIYGIQYIFIDILGHLNGVIKNNIVWKTILPFIVLLLSYQAIKLLSKNKMMRNLIT